MLTYKRFEVLLRTLLHLSGLPSLRKVIVIWNDVEQPVCRLGGDVSALKRTQISVREKLQCQL